MKFNTKIYIFFFFVPLPQASMLAMSENSAFVGKRGNHPENCGQQAVPRKKKKDQAQISEYFL